MIDLEFKLLSDFKTEKKYNLNIVNILFFYRSIIFYDVKPSKKMYSYVEKYEVLYHVC